jgi:ankyrin repeat protein
MDNIKTFENFNNQDIFLSIKNNDIESVKNYINSGYDLNEQDKHGETALIFATSKNNIEIVKLPTLRFKKSLFISL